MIPLDRRTWLIGAGCLVTVAASSVGRTQDATAIDGEYVHSRMELVAGLRLNADGTFDYGLTVGSFDERARGRWTRRGGRVDLVSDPRPVAPAIVAGGVEPAPGERFGLRVVGPNGRDVAGIDFVVEYDVGEPVAAYMSGDRWTLPANEQRMPRFVTFAMPSYRLQSPRLAVRGAAGTTANFTLIPNDFGVADLTGVPVTIEDGELVMRREGEFIRFRRVER